MAATTAVVAGTAGAVSHHQQQKYANQEQQAAEQQAAQQQAAAPAAAAPAEAADPQTAQLEKLAQLHAQGILTDDEYSSAKAKALGI